MKQHKPILPLRTQWLVTAPSVSIPAEIQRLNDAKERLVIKLAFQDAYYSKKNYRDIPEDVRAAGGLLAAWALMEPALTIGELHHIHFNPRHIFLILLGAVAFFKANEIKNELTEVAKKTHDRLEKNPEDQKRFINSLIAAGKITKPTQAYMLGLAIHNVGYQVLSLLEEVETNCESITRIQHPLKARRLHRKPGEILAAVKDVTPMRKIPRDGYKQLMEIGSQLTSGEALDSIARQMPANNAALIEECRGQVRSLVGLVDLAERAGLIQPCGSRDKDGIREYDCRVASDYRRTYEAPQRRLLHRLRFQAAAL